MKIVVTGGAGYVGSVLTGLLLKKGHHVIVYDRMDYGVQSLLHLAEHPNISIVHGDIRDVDRLGECISGADVVMHLAGIVGYPACAADPEEAHRTNVIGTNVVLSRMQEKQFLIYPSTGSVYGKVELKAHEETAPAPLSLYGQQKVSCEKEIRARDIPYVILRFATLFGLSPRMRLDLLVNDFVYQALHQKQIVLYEGHFKRSFLHVEDAARAYLTVLQHMRSGETYNVGCEQMAYTKREIALIIRKWVTFYLHEADAGHDVDQRDYEVDYHKFCKLGFKHAICLEESIPKMIPVLRMLKERSALRNA